MKRPLQLTFATAAILAFAACTPAAAEPGWTFGPGAEPIEAPVAAATPAPPSATPAPPSATPAPPSATPAPPSATPQPVATPAQVLGTREAPRVINVTMGNFFFEPAAINVRTNETIRLVVDNPTTIVHELVLGTAEEQEHHAQEMADAMAHSDGDHHMMDEPNQVEVEPGESAELVWTFDQAGEQLLGCHVAGHWEAGMHGTIEVRS